MKVHEAAPASAVLAMLLASASCALQQEPEQELPAAPYVWSLPAGVEPPPQPEHNPTTSAKVELGRRLFVDARLSANGQRACVSCHDSGRAFSEPESPSIGLYGEELDRSAPGLANVGYLRVYTWSNPLLTELEAQALVPLLARRPSELDIADRVDEVLLRLTADPQLQRWRGLAFPEGRGAFSLNEVTEALAAYQRTLIAVDSAYDRFLAGDTSALSDSAERGRQLFFSERLRCGECHGGRWLSDAAEPGSEEPFHNTGLYNLDGVGAYPRRSPGLIEFTGKPADRGRFRTPPLRNVARTAPFMHDGSVATLAEVIEHYGAGGRTIDGGAFAGVGADNPYKDPRIAGFALLAAEGADLIAFLESLTDEAFIARSVAEHEQLIVSTAMAEGN